MKLKVRVEIELVASLDVYLNATVVIITVHWLREDLQAAGRNLLGGKVKKIHSSCSGFLLDFAEWCKWNTTNLLW